ncbi:hypothetical protein D9758_015445 [Tetrapyrgos nigripes]|uniref:CHAT domain-containing protein n=1 Tax=Tetrapyrgos nigripes TaxID=182062 RepID=A0A8H5CLT4_9AGAR|nr:hypothetical protein D9758_015445 [Tetrapyrgos nigripes]
MSESNIPLVDQTRDPATEVGADRTLAQPTPDYHEDEAAELEMAISMSLGQSNAETTEDSSDDYMAIDIEEQAELDQALFLSSLPSELFDEQVAQLSETRAEVELLSGWEMKVNELNDSAVQLAEHFQQSGDCAEIDSAVQLMEAAIKLIPDGHNAAKSCQLSNLGSAFSYRFERLGELGDIENAICFIRQAVDLTPDGHADKAAMLNNLGKAFSFDLSAVDLTPDGHADKAAMLNNLGSAFESRFERLGELGDIENAIRFKRQAVDLTPDGHADKAARLNNLGSAFESRFERLGELGDIENAIHFMHQGVDLTPDGHADKAAMLNNLGIAFSCRFERLGELGDIENTIRFKRQAVDLTPDGHADKAAWLNNLGNAFSHRFERLGELGDIENAIRFMHQAVDLTPDDHADKAAMLNNLGNAFETRLTNLGNAFSCRFKRLGELGDIENAIHFKRQAVDLTPDGHADKAYKLNNLGSAFSHRFERLGELADIENAIRFNCQAVDLTPDGHADKAAQLNNLGNAFESRFECLGELGDIKNAISTFQQSTKNSSSPPSVRYKAACRWATLSSAYQDSSLALDAYKVVFEIIPQFIWLGQTVHQRYEELPKIGRTINAAVATAISAGNLTQAVEWLEEGRGIVWGQLLQLRSPLDDLHDQHPQLAKDLERVSRVLENAGTSTRSNVIDITNVHGSVTGEQEAQQHTRLAAEYEELIVKIRDLDGFDSFLKPKKLSALTPASANGPVIMLNIDQLRCDAIILSSSHGINHFPLPKLSFKQVEELRLKLLSSLEASNVRVDRNGERKSIQLARGKQCGDQFKSVLAELWSKVVQPILSEIEDVLHDSAEHHLPHITWCATGALAFLPIHAAGIYGSKDPSDNIKLSDFTVSSYTTTLSAMLNSGCQTKQEPREKPKVLIVSQPATPGLNLLPGTEKEAMAIQAYTTPEGSLHLTHHNAIVDTVKNEMNKYEIVHLACHGIQDTKNPLNSAFALYDGRLKLHDLMKLSLENAELAFLSACQTAAGDENLPEESVHLAAGMLAIGYPSVIATMWSIGDKDAPIVADKVYESLLERHDEPVTRNPRQIAAYALHGAVEHLRDKVGEMEFVRWVPFVHYGV